MAWLKSPVGAPAIPTAEVLAFSYAALQPSKQHWNKYLREIDKLEAQGKITEKDHQLLRSSPVASDELVHLTLGNDIALTEETVTETLERVSNEIKKEEKKELDLEKKEHEKTHDRLVELLEEKQKIQECLYWRCNRKAKSLAWIVAVVVAFLLICGIAGSGLYSQPTNPIIGGVLITSSVVLALLTLVNLLFGSTVKSLYQRVQRRCLTWLLKREAATTGIGLTNIGGV